MPTPQERRAATALLVGTLAPLLILWMHPTGADISAGRLLMVNHLVHGVAIAAQPVVFLGLLGLWSALRSDLATAALVFYGFGSIAILTAAVLSGFVAPEAASEPALLHYTGALNQAFAKVSVTATSASIVLWGAALWQSGVRGLARIAALAGLLIGAVLALGVISGMIHLDVHGILLVTVLQGLWLILVAAHLLQEKRPT